MSSRWNIVWAAPWGLLSWLAVELLVFAPILILGLILCPFLWAPIIQVESRVNAGQQIEAFRWCWAQALWGNWEDGLLPAWWVAQCGGRFSWFLRNPVSNMRYWPVISTTPDPARVRVIGSPTIPPDGTPCCFLTWQGPFVGFRWQCATWGVWAGWAVNPKDIQGMPNDWRRFGFSVIGQLLRF